MKIPAAGRKDCSLGNRATGAPARGWSLGGEAGAGAPAWDGRLESGDTADALRAGEGLALRARVVGDAEEAARRGGARPVGRCADGASASSVTPRPHMHATVAAAAMNFGAHGASVRRILGCKSSGQT